MHVVAGLYTATGRRARIAGYHRRPLFHTAKDQAGDMPPKRRSPRKASPKKKVEQVVEDAPVESAPVAEPLSDVDDDLDAPVSAAEIAKANKEAQKENEPAGAEAEAETNGENGNEGSDSDDDGIGKIRFKKKKGVSGASAEGDDEEAAELERLASKNSKSEETDVAEENGDEENEDNDDGKDDDFFDEEEEDFGSSSKKASKASKPKKSKKTTEDEPAEERGPLTGDAKIIDDLFNKMKSKKKRKRDGEDTYLALDPIVSEFVENMKNAARNDIESFESNKPALEKMKFLPKVRTMFTKSVAHELLLNKGALITVRLWLEPFDNGTLPTLDIQRTLFDLLTKLDVVDEDYTYMKDSGIGRIVAFYAKFPKVSRDVQKIAQSLVDKWSRPLLSKRAKTTA